MIEHSSRFTAVIRDCGAPELLAPCIRHHLAIGADHVFVSLAGSDADLPGVMRDDPRIRFGRLPEATWDAIPFLADALREVVEWSLPDWLLFAASDELWLPEAGRLAAARELDASDAFVVERFGAPAIQAAGGRVIPPELAMPQRVPLVVGREAPADEGPSVLVPGAPRLMIRPRALEALASHGATLRRRAPDDLLIVHAPFTTEQRFARDVRAACMLMDEHADRFGASEAARWRRRAAMSEEGRSAEFLGQTILASALPSLQAKGVVASGAAAVYKRLAAQSDVLSADALREELAGPSRPRADAPPAEPRLAPPPPAAAAAWSPAPLREVASADECYFYHCMDIPGHGEVIGQWDLRGHEQAYLGGVDLRGREVLEIGTASGHLGFWMERQGALVTAFDIDEHQDWDIVPFFGFNQAAIVESRRAVMRQINNSWWFARNRLGSSLEVVYGSVYHLSRLERMFDVVTLNSVLLHLRDPFHALAQAAARCRETMVVTDVGEEFYLGVDAPFADRNSMHFIPTAANRGPLDTWWFLPENLMREFLMILGFPKVEITRHKQRFMPDQDWPCYTAVATR